MRDIKLLKSWWFYLALFFVLCGIGFLVFFHENSNNSVKNTTRYTIEFTLTEPSTHVSVAYDKFSHDTWLFKNGTRQKKLSNVARKPAKFLSLPSTTKVVDITSTKPVSALTWDSSLKESAEYVSYLKSKGFKSLLQVNTPNYIEIYLQQGSTRKRLIIQHKTLMAGDLTTSAKLPSVNEFIKSLSYLGGV